MSDLEVALLARLLEKGQCQDAKKYQTLLERFRQAKWIGPSTRLNVWVMRPDARAAICTRLNQLRPSWQEDAQLLRQAGLDPLNSAHWPTAAALRARPSAAGWVHRKTWNAATSAGSKSASRIVAEATLTDDWALRGRVNCQTILDTPDGDVDLLRLTQLLTEFSIPERGWRRCRGLRGELPSYILTVENIGALVDVTLPPKTMVLYSQGTAYQAAVQLLKAAPEAQWVHFGDLDPAGVTIAKRMARVTARPLRFYVPTFAQEYLHRKLPAKRVWRGCPVDHAVLRELNKANAWLEQEVFLLDGRLQADIDTYLQSTALY